jgi:hypothetical protein
MLRRRVRALQAPVPLRCCSARAASLPHAVRIVCCVDRATARIVRRTLRKASSASEFDDGVAASRRTLSLL